VYISLTAAHESCSKRQLKNRRDARGVGAVACDAPSPLDRGFGLRLVVEQKRKIELKEFADSEDSHKQSE
jgi:hypothetical protein